MMTNAEVIDKGITCLLDVLGAVDTERFISILNYEKFDYTKWQRERFDNVDVDEFFKAAMKYAKENPFE